MLYFAYKDPKTSNPVEIEIGTVYIQCGCTCDSTYWVTYHCHDDTYTLTSTGEIYIGGEKNNYQISAGKLGPAFTQEMTNLDW